MGVRNEAKQLVGDNPIRLAVKSLEKLVEDGTPRYALEYHKRIHGLVLE